MRKNIKLRKRFANKIQLKKKFSIFIKIHNNLGKK
jgi:hypothetical protein